MEIRGAIFDCDGTLVDSMGMWAQATSWVFGHYGASMPEGFFERVRIALSRDAIRWRTSAARTVASPAR